MENNLSQLSLQGEEWKPITDFTNYLVSNYGRFYSLNAKLILSPEIKKNYFRVRLSKNGIKHVISAHRLVAKEFHPNPEDKPQVNHIDFNPQNNRADNLEWCTAMENRLHSLKSGRKSKRTIYVYTLDGNLIDSKDCISDYAKENNIPINEIYYTASKNRPYGNIRFSFDNPENIKPISYPQFQEYTKFYQYDLSGNYIQELQNLTYHEDNKIVTKNKILSTEPCKGFRYSFNKVEYLPLTQKQIKQAKIDAKRIWNILNPFIQKVGADNEKAVTIYKYTPNYQFVEEIKGIKAYCNKINSNYNTFKIIVRKKYIHKGYRYLRNKVA